MKPFRPLLLGLARTLARTRARPLAYTLAYVWLRTLRLRWPDGASLPDRGIILLWHEHLPVCIRAFSGRGIHVLISKSRDGEWAAQACVSMGYQVHRGSSSARGDGKALGGLRALARAAGKEPSLIGMALDGPRGPRRVPKPGSLWLAQRLSLPVIPVAVEARWGFRVRSWDRTLVPWPFSRVDIRVGSPIFPDAMESLRQAMRAVESKPG